MSHPRPDTLVAFLQGELAPEGVAPLEAHLLTCPECVLALDRLGAAESDTFLSRLRSMHEDGPSSGATEAGSLPARPPADSADTVKEKMVSRPAPPRQPRILKSGRAYRYLWLPVILTAGLLLFIHIQSMRIPRPVPENLPEPGPRVDAEKKLPPLTELIEGAKKSLAWHDLPRAEDRLKLALRYLEDPAIDPYERSQVHFLLGEVRKSQGNVAAAAAMWLQALDVPEDGKDQATAAFYLGHWRLLRGEYADAEKCFERSRSWREHHLPADDAGVLNVWEAQGDLAAAQKQYAFAEARYAQVAAFFKDRESANHLEIQNKLLRLELAQEKWLAAEALTLEIVASLTNALGPQAEKVLKAEATLLDLYQRKNDASSAEPIRKRHLAVHTRQLGKDHSRVHELTDSLARCYLAQKKFAEAELLLMANYRAGSRAETRQWLAELYDAWGKPDEAKKWRGNVNER